MAKAPQKSKDAKAKAAAGGGKKSKKKWSKGKSRDKLQNMCLFDKPTYDKVLKEVPNYKVRTFFITRAPQTTEISRRNHSWVLDIFFIKKFFQVITPSIVSDRMKIRGSLARRAIKELHGMGKIKLLVQHSSQMVYTRAIAVDDEEEEVVETKKKGKK